jgi:hypothetical protein
MQSLTFVHNDILKTCEQVEMYSQAIVLHVIRGVSLPLLANTSKLPLYGQQTTRCTNSYGTFMLEFNQR